MRRPLGPWFKDLFIIALLFAPLRMHPPMEIALATLAVVASGVGYFGWRAVPR